MGNVSLITSQEANTLSRQKAFEITLLKRKKEIERQKQHSILYNSTLEKTKKYIKNTILNNAHNGLFGIEIRLPRTQLANVDKIKIATETKLYIEQRGYVVSLLYDFTTYKDIYVIIRW